MQNEHFPSFFIARTVGQNSSKFTQSIFLGKRNPSSSKECLYFKMRKNSKKTIYKYICILTLVNNLSSHEQFSSILSMANIIWYKINLVNFLNIKNWTYMNYIITKRFSGLLLISFLNNGAVTKNCYENWAMLSVVLYCFVLLWNSWKCLNKFNPLPFHPPSNLYRT